MPTTLYAFEELTKINTSKYGPIINRVYFALRNGRSEAKDKLLSLQSDELDQIIDLISRMATVHNLQSKKITWRIHKYHYGEIKPHPHRFFFFQICGNNIIIFAYKEKKKDSLKDSFYKDLEKERDIYAENFR